MQRIVKGRTGLLRLPVDSSVTAGTLTLQRDRDEVVIVNAQAVTVQAAEVTYSLPAQSDEANLTALWTLTTAGGTNVVTEPVEIVSCETVSLDEVRLRRPLDDPNRYPDRILLAARAQLENELSERAGVKFAGGEFTVTCDGNGQTDLFLTVGKPRTITSVTINDTALTAEQLATVKVDERTGVVYYPARFTAGRLNVTVTGVSGYAQPVGGLSSAMSKGIRYMVVDSPTFDRAISVSNNDGTTENLVVAGLRGAIFAIPELNTILENARLTYGIA
jgi:hypothetical protein